MACARTGLQAECDGRAEGDDAQVHGRSRTRRENSRFDVKHNNDNSRVLSTRIRGVGLVFS